MSEERNERTGIYLSLNYLGPRKRKSKRWGCTGGTADECLYIARDYLHLNGGKYVSGFFTACDLYDVQVGDKTIVMQSIPLFAVAEVVKPGQINYLNGGGIYESRPVYTQSSFQQCMC